MSDLKLTELPLTYADSISFENSGSTFQIKIINCEHQLVIFLKKILTFNFSANSLKTTEDWIDIIDITHEYRRLTSYDLRKYSFSNENIDELPHFNVISLYGNVIIEIICEEIEVCESES